MIPDHPRFVTTGWTYLRFHGNGYAGSYSLETLGNWARWMKACLSEGTDVYAYFNNDDQGYAVKNAVELRRFVRGH